MAEDNYIIHIVQNPATFELTRRGITSHYHSAAGPIRDGWYFYYERKDGAFSQIFGPFMTKLAAKGCATSDTYRLNKTHRWLNSNGRSVK